MATRRQQAAPSRQPAAPRAQGVEQLPDDLLTRILGGLSLRERQVAALVSRRWHRCAHAPELCRNLTVAIDEWQPRASDWRQEARAPNLASFAAWLQRHGQHLRCLQLEVLPYDGYDEQAVGQELARCMSAAMPQLDQLLITLHNNWLTVGWAGQLLPSLRELGVHLYGWDEKLRISASLGGLTHLTKLVLSASRLKLNAGVQLPPSLRTLALNGNSKRGLPQLAGLTRLETFAMGSFAYNVDGLSVFTAMKQLTFLDLSNLSWHPFIGSLTNLQHLAVLDHTCIVAALDFEQVNTALERLTQLTTLLLEADRSWEGRVPPALAGQSRLQRLYYAGLTAAPLPLGPYSASLRVLCAGMQCLSRSTALLASCGSLEHVVVLHDDCDHPCPFWQWAVQHPPLRLLQPCCYPPQASSESDSELFSSGDESGAELSDYDELFSRQACLARQTAHSLEVGRLREARPQLAIQFAPSDAFMTLFRFHDPYWLDIKTPGQDD